MNPYDILGSAILKLAPDDAHFGPWSNVEGWKRPELVEVMEVLERTGNQVAVLGRATADAFANYRPHAVYGDGQLMHLRADLCSFEAWRHGEPGGYPCQIGVYCDRCGTTVEHDYLVHDYMDKAARLECARRHLRENEGWSCGPDGDFCPRCAKSNDPEQNGTE